MEKKSPPTRSQARKAAPRAQAAAKPRARTAAKPEAQPVAKLKASLAAPLERFGRWIGTTVSRPKVRTVLVGVALILIGTLLVTHSFWTFPIVGVGVLMVVVAWVGSRLEGSFSLDWGELGAGFELRAHFKAPPRPGDPKPDDLEELRALLAATPLPERGSATDEL